MKILTIKQKLVMMALAIAIGILGGISGGSLYFGVLMFYVVLIFQVVAWIVENYE